MKIAIIGAGPAGCMLARLLHQRNPSITTTIFESESSINFRSQGGTLDLHIKTGQLAMRQAGLWDEFQKHVRYDGEAMKIADKNLLCYIKVGAGKPNSAASSGRPEIDRPVLREMLYRSLPEGAVKWKKKLGEVKREGADLTLCFADGTVERGFDLIVGADGAWSKVRNLISDAKPFYSGIAGHAMHINDAATRTPTLYEAVNRGSLFSFSDGKGIFAQYMGDGSLSIATWSVRDQDWQNAYDVHDTASTKAVYKEEYADWHPTLQRFLQEADDEVAPRNLFMLPIGHSWRHVPGVTLIGDAAHLMTPFAGEGVNLAFADSLQLADAIVAAATSAIAVADQKGELDIQVTKFEQEMFKRSTETQRMTWEMLKAMFLTPGAPRLGIERYIIQATKGEMGWWVATFILTPVVYAWFFVFKLLY
ncbi:hypothetical protein LTS14_009237 [Recurvomyces mirabilis]|uniref:uncharacterized protein n=1 Tax=Recurvomyces mirabilis TaxID=574656 RepID=UPI002DE0ED88|nr:hypothetical protein LTS14_009237 [Recurvomyces mirabilis]